MKFIGKRVVKTAIAVFIAVSIYSILMVVDKILGVDRNENMFAPTNWYTPFFAGIAAAYALQNNPERSTNQAQIRSFGSLIGGTFGAIIIHIYEEAYLLLSNVNDIDLLQNNFDYKMLEFIFTSLGVLILIPLTVKLKRSNAVFISILTYLSVTISIRNGGMDVFFFAFNRILSTVIGVLISLFINSIDSFRKRNNEILFVQSIDSSKMVNGSLSGFQVYEINNLVNLGCNLTYTNDRTLTSFATSLKNIKLNNDVFLLDGLISYDNATRKYLANKEISPLERGDIESILDSFNSPYFTYQVNDSRFSCYFKELSNEAIKSYYDKRVDSTHYTFSKAIAPSDMGISLYYVIDKADVINKIKDKIQAINTKNKYELKVSNNEMDGYLDLKIRPSGISSSVLVKELYKKTNAKYLIVQASRDTDLSLYSSADYTFCLKRAPQEVQDKVNYVIESLDPNELLKFIYKIYFKKDYKKYLDKIKIR